MSNITKIKNKKRYRSHRTEESLNEKSILSKLELEIHEDPPLVMRSKCKCRVCMFKKLENNN